MGRSTASDVQADHTSLSRWWATKLVALAITFALPSNAQMSSNSSIDLDAFFELSDWFRPRKGQIISPKDIVENQHNFRFCDGTTAKIEIANLVESTPCSAGHRDGAFKLVSAPFEELVGASVWTADYEFVGEINDIQIGEGGELIGFVVEKSEAWTSLDQTFFVPQTELRFLQSHDGSKEAVFIGNLANPTFDGSPFRHGKFMLQEK